MFYKSNFGVLKDNYLLLYKLNSEMIVVDNITAIEINERKVEILIFYNYFKSLIFDFTIRLDNEEEIKFSFEKEELESAIEFKDIILNAKCSA